MKNLFLAMLVAIPCSAHSASFYTLNADLSLDGFSFFGYGFGYADADPASRQYLLDTGNCTEDSSDPGYFSCSGRFDVPLNSPFVEFDNEANGWFENLSVTVEIDSRMFGLSGYQFADLYSGAFPNLHFNCTGSTRICGSLFGFGSFSFSEFGYGSEVFGGDSWEIANLGKNGNYTYLYDHWAPTISGLGFFNGTGGGNAFYSVTNFSLTPPAVPISATAPLLVTSLAGLTLFARRRRKRQ